MTSDSNHTQTKEFFVKNNYFNYPKDKIIFFKQNKLPLLDLNGKCILKNKSEILEESNGNGDVFLSIKNNKIISKLQKTGVKWIHFSSIDNILLNNIDELFIGLVIKNKQQLAVKSIFKERANEKEWIITKYKNNPFLLDFNFIKEQLSNEQKSNKYLYRDICIHIYLMDINLLDKLTNCNLPYHRACRVYDYLNEFGELIQEKCYKFEKFIFDILPYCKDILVLRVDKTYEFAPIKNKVGINSIETAVKLYENYKKND